MTLFSSKIFYLKKVIIFPYCTISVVISLSNNSKEIKKGDKIIAFPIRTFFDILFYKNRIATLSEVLDVNIDGDTIKINLKGLLRTRLKKINKLQLSDFELIDEQSSESLDQIKEELRKKSQELIFLINVEESDRLIKLLNFLTNLNQMEDFISNYFIIDFRKRYKLFNELNIKKRGVMLISLLNDIIKNLKSQKEKEVL